MPEDHAGGFVLKVEEVEFAAETAVIALFSFFEHLEVGLLLVLGRPGRAVDALQHFVLAVAAPVGAGNLHEAMHLEDARRRDVRTAAEVDEVALAVERNRFAFGNRADDLGLVVFAESLEEVDRFVSRHFLANDGDVLLHELVHALLDLLKIFGREGTRVGEVVVEAVFNRRPDRHLRFREEFLDGLSHQVRGRMTNDLKAFRIAARDDRHGGIRGDLVREVHELAVNLAGKRSLGETRTDRGGDFADRHGIGIFALGTVWKSDYYHFFESSQKLRA